MSIKGKEGERGGRESREGLEEEEEGMEVLISFKTGDFLTSIEAKGGRQGRRCRKHRNMEYQAPSGLSSPSQGCCVSDVISRWVRVVSVTCRVQTEAGGVGRAGTLPPLPARRSDAQGVRYEYCHINSFLLQDFFVISLLHLFSRTVMVKVTADGDPRIDPAHVPQFSFLPPFMNRTLVRLQIIPSCSGR